MFYANNPIFLITSNAIIHTGIATTATTVDNNEQFDVNNGFIFTPTYDRLFDKGFISFNDDYWRLYIYKLRQVG